MSEPICKECMRREYCNRSDINFQPKPEVVPPVLQCDSFKTAKITNADRIRSMTNEELAEWIVNRYCDTCPDGYAWSEGCVLPDDCVGCWEHWLKEEAVE